MAQLVVTYSTPTDPDAFARHYHEVHAPLARKIPGLRKFEVTDGPVMTPQGPSDVVLIATLHFDSLDDIAAAFAARKVRSPPPMSRLSPPAEHP